MKVSANPTGIYHFPFFSERVLVAFSGREFSGREYDRFLEELGIPKEHLCLVSQVHGSEIIGCDEPIRESRLQEADGMIAATKGLALGILTADCVPIFFWDPVKHAIAIAHGGWRGIRAGIAVKTIQRFEDSFGSEPKDIRVGFGPCIRECCYEVGLEFQSYFPRFFSLNQATKHPKKGAVDLPRILRHQFSESGVADHHIFDCETCTACNNDHFFSARRERGTTNRILSLIRMIS